MIKPGDLVVSILEPDLLMGVLTLKRCADNDNVFDYYANCIYFNGTDYTTIELPVEYLVHRDESIGPENVLNNPDHTLYTEDGDTVLIRTVKHVG